MGRKGVSKRKPKKPVAHTTASISGSANAVQVLVKKDADTSSRGSANPLTGTNGKNRK
jgi:hypothetical protein